MRRCGALDGAGNGALNGGNPTGDPLGPVGAAFLRPGHEQVAAGYAVYGPSTMLVLSVGNGTHGFTLDRDVGNFVLTHSDIRIPEDTASSRSTHRTNASGSRRCAVTCRNARTAAAVAANATSICAGSPSMVAEVHRILMRGGVFMYPRDFRRRRPWQGRLRLLYEANPMSFLIEQAGGMRLPGANAFSMCVPQANCMRRVPVILGFERTKWSALSRYHTRLRPRRGPALHVAAVYPSARCSCLKRRVRE
jgi:fructose-1,6-bisphosphatase